MLRKNLTDKDTEGLKVEFGNQEIIPILIEKIAKREGIGDLLAEGSYRAAQKIGPQAVPLSMSVKGQEMPAHMPQFKQSLAVIYAVNPFGADHQSSEHDLFLMLPPDTEERKWLGQLGCNISYDKYETLDDGKAAFAFTTQNSSIRYLCLCQFAWGPAWQLYGRRSGTVVPLRNQLGNLLYELMQIGERRINMMRAFNARRFHSQRRQNPDRLFEPLPDGRQGSPCDRSFEAAKKRYYELPDGIRRQNPTEATLKNLN